MTRYRDDKGGIYDRFTRSVAPRIYGNEELVLEILVRWTLYRSRAFSRKSITCFPSTLPFTGSYYITDGPSSPLSSVVEKRAARSRARKDRDRDEDDVSAQSVESETKLKQSEEELYASPRNKRMDKGKTTSNWFTAPNHWSRPKLRVFAVGEASS